MANTITNVLPKLVARGLMALREQAIMPRLVNNSYSNLAAQKGNVINVPIPSAIAARDITASITMNSNVDSSPTAALVTLDFWKEAPFHMSDNDVVSAINDFPVMQASEAVKSLANAVDDLILGKHTGFFGHAGAAGTTPFATTISVASEARKLLNKQLAPMSDRRIVLDPDAEANALELSNVLQFDQRGDQGGIIQGTIGRKLGMDWHLDQNVGSFTPGTGWVTGMSFATAGHALADTTVTLINATASGTVLIGDVFSHNSNQHVILSAATASSTVGFTVEIYPGLSAAVVSGDAVTVIATAYTANLAFHRDAFAWASRPLADVEAPGSNMFSMSDSVSGIALRVELSRQYKQTTFSYDILGGANVVRRELGVKVFG